LIHTKYRIIKRTFTKVTKTTYFIDYINNTNHIPLNLPPITINYFDNFFINYINIFNCYTNNNNNKLL